jgi:hypothetical protein
MKPWRWLLACAGLLLLAGLNLVHGADRVLVRGDPPLTLKNVDRFQRLWEWYCDIRLTPPQRRQLQQAFANLWRKRYKAGNETALASHRALEKEWLVLQDMEGAEQDRKRARTRAIWISNMRKSKDDVCRFLVPIYNAAYRPGGRNNPILVAGDSPLTKTMIDVDRELSELLLDLTLTVKQRKEHQRLMVEGWNNFTQEERAGAVKSINKWGAVLPSYSNYTRHVERALTFPKSLNRWVKNRDSNPFSRWMLVLYESSSKPGSTHNPVLGADKPKLTQLVVDRYGDYVEIMLDLSVCGGLTTPQRQVLKDYLVKDWKKMTAEEREELLADLKGWADAAGTGAAEANESIGALRPKLLARLQTTENRQSSKWLLEIAAQERRKAKALAEDQRMMFEAMRRIIRINENGHWRTNSKGHVEWEPGR